MEKAIESVRIWLIQKLAGKPGIVMNVELNGSVAPKHTGANLPGHATMDDLERVTCPKCKHFGAITNPRWNAHSEGMGTPGA